MTGAAAIVGEIRNLLAASSGGTTRPELLTQAIRQTQRLLAAPGFDALDGGARALVWSLGAAAVTFRARSPAAEPGDLDRGIAWTEMAVASWESGDPNLPGAQSNLATALLDRYESEGAEADLQRALELFDLAVPALLAAGRRIDISMHSQGNAFHERAKAGGAVDIDDLDRAMELFRAALAQQDPDDDERAGYLNSLGLSLRAKGRAVADPHLMRDADGAFREGRRLADTDGDNQVAATLNLAALLTDRAEIENQEALLREAIGLYRDVIPTLTGRRRQTATTNLAAAMLDLYRYTRDRVALDDAISELSGNAVALQPGPARDITLSNLGAALHEIFGYTGRIPVLDEAIRVQEQLLTPPSPRLAERTLNLGVSLLDRFRRRQNPDDLERAIDLFVESAASATSVIDRASALNSQANALFLRFEATSHSIEQQDGDNRNEPACDNRKDSDDLKRCVDLREQAVMVAPVGSVDAALYRANLGVDLLRSFELSGDSTELTRAIAEQRRAVAEAPPAAAEQPRLLAGLADSLARRADLGAGDDAVVEVRETYRRVVESGRQSMPEQAMSAAVRWGDWEARREDWAAAGAAFEMGLDLVNELVARQQLRADKQSWLGDADGVSTKACHAFAQIGMLGRAVTALERGRAVLLVGALQHRHLVTHSPA